MPLKYDTPYMIDRDGKVYATPPVHPYILYMASDEFSLNLPTFGNSPQWVDWFYTHTDSSIKKKIVECLQFIADIFVSDATINIRKWFGLTLDNADKAMWGAIFDKYHVVPKTLSYPIDEWYYLECKQKWEELNDACNDLFLRMRMGNAYTSGTDKAIYFRVSSNDFDWFDIIWDICYQNRAIIEDVTIMVDKQSSKDADSVFYVLDGRVINKLPINEFITLSGNPVVEKLSVPLTEGMKKREYSMIRKALLEDASEEEEEEVEEEADNTTLSIEELLKELNINKRGNYSEDGAYVIDLNSSNEFGVFSSKLDRSDLLEPLDDSSYVTSDNSNLDYKYEDKYLLSLIADFDGDYYSLVITNLEE